MKQERAKLNSISTRNSSHRHSSWIFAMKIDIFALSAILAREKDAQSPQRQLQYSQPFTR